MTEQIASRSSEISSRRRISLAPVLSSFSAVRSRLWRIGPPLVFAALLALLATHVQKRTFQATATVSFKGVTFVPDLIDPDPFMTTMTTQVSLARSPELAARVVAAAGVPGINPVQFLRHSSAKPQSDADILNLSVSYRKPATAIQLANAYASQFTRYKAELDLAPIKRFISKVEARIKSLRAHGATGSPVYDELVANRMQGERLDSLVAHQARVQQVAKSAPSLRAHALRYGIIGGLLGALLGIALVAVVRIWPKNSPPPGRMAS
jgi:hypothetical protein